MQPDPSLFLQSIRREMLRIVESGTISNPVDALTLKRAADGLGYWAAFDGSVGHEIEALIARQHDLLSLLAGKLDSIGAKAVGIDEATSEAGEIFATSDGIAQRYDINAKAVDRALVRLDQALKDHPSDRRVLSGYYRAASTIETEARQALAKGFARLVTAEKSRVATPDECGRSLPSPAELTEYLRRTMPDKPNIEVLDVSGHRGVNTKDIMFLRVVEGGDWPNQIVMRRLRAFTVNQRVSLRYEYDLQRELKAAGLPVAKPLLLEEGDALSQPFVLMETIAGTTMSASALGENGRAIMADVAAVLARVHRFDYRKAPRPGELELTPFERLRDHIERDFSLWRRSQTDPSPTVEGAFQWLRTRLCDLSDATALVHGDFDLRNLLIDTGHVSAVLDWERSHISHPAEDLAYCRTDAERVMPWNEFLSIYRDHGGFEVTESELEFFAVTAQVLRLVSIGRAFDGYRKGEHADFLLGSAIYLERNAIIETLYRLMETVAWSRA